MEASPGEEAREGRFVALRGIPKSEVHRRRKCRKGIVRDPLSSVAASRSELTPRTSSGIVTLW